MAKKQKKPKYPKWVRKAMVKHSDLEVLPHGYSDIAGCQFAIENYDNVRTLERVVKLVEEYENYNLRVYLRVVPR